MPCEYRAVGCASRSLPTPYGSTIWPGVQVTGEDQRSSARPGRGRARPESGRAGSRRAASESGKPLGRSAIHERGSTPASSTAVPRSSTRPTRRRAASRARARPSSTGCENGSREIAMSWLPSTTYGCPSRSSSASSVGLAARTREQVAGEADEIGPTLLDPARPHARPPVRPRDGTPRWKSDRCAIRRPSSSARQSVDSARSSTRSRTQPASNQPYARARRPPGRRRPDDESRGRAQIWSFSMTGSTETTCRLNLSSDSSSPAATPTSCERWRIGMP